MTLTLGVHTDALKPGYLLKFMGTYRAILPPAGQNTFTSSDLVLTNTLLHNLRDKNNGNDLRGTI